MLRKRTSRYFEAMNHRSDDFEELFALLSKASERCRSVRATLVHAVNATPAEEANRRFAGRARHGHPGQAGPARARRLLRRVQRPRSTDLPLASGARSLGEEIYDPEGRLKEAEVHGGKNGPRWTYEEHDTAQEARAVYMPRVPERQETDTRFSFMVDSSEYTFSETFWDGTIVDKTGRELAVAGRGCVEVRAKTVS